MDLTPTTPATNPIGTIAYAGADPAAGKSTLGADDFMKLLTVQLSSQNPMEPMKDTEFISQMANFTSLEQMRTLSNSFSSFAATQAMAAAPSYLGHKVTVTDPNSEAGPVTGTVQSIVMKDGAPAVVIDGKPYSIKLITEVSS